MFKKLLLCLLLFALTPLSGYADLISPVNLIDPMRLVPPMRPAQTSPFIDPTRPPEQIIADVPVDQVKEEPRLSAIWITAKSRWVTINNIQAKKGDTIAGDITIIKIRKNEVTITQNGTTKTLQLLQSPYKIQ